MCDEIDEVYLVNSGAMKVHRFSESGEQQILGFYLAGDIVGLEALSTGIACSEAVALDTTSITRIRLSSVFEGREAFTSQDLVRLMGVSLTRENDLAMMLSQRTADRRLAWFLTEYANRLAVIGFSPKEFSLTMTRTDMALYLGLALETVCRELAGFEEQGLISKDRRRIKLLDIDALKHLATGDEHLPLAELTH
jgi:CRP/FNR family transcriptional regulator